MNWQDLHFPINLDIPPQIYMLGHSRHGAVPVECYRFPALWCLHLYPYDAEVIVDGLRLPIRPGYAEVIAPNCTIEYRYKRIGAHLYAHFTLPPPYENTAIPAMQDTGSEFVRLWQNFELAIACGKARPHRAQSIIWQILWELTEPSDAHNAAAAPIGEWVSPTGQLGLVGIAMELIEERLAQHLTVGDLADELQVSHNHLTRQFRAQTGSTVVGYVQKRRTERAYALLTSTLQSIRSIAVDVGVPDLQQFNKLIRRFLGASPTEIRQSGGRRLQA